ncbi:MAG: type IV pilus twitching motility protein PilT [Dehalococcoidales bacterium]|nr:type IV pilus twitching motility protein PilT [Dehalococcoidales bacterium]
MDLDSLLLKIKEDGASDLHLNAGSHPSARIDGALCILNDYEVLTPSILESVLVSITTEQQRETLETRRELDLAYYIPDVCRFRVNILHQRNSLSFNFRVIATDVAPLSLIGLPDIYAKISLSRKGLILVTGPTGSGKSTTLAAMINYINDNISRHIVTIEDPIEYLHPNKQSVILQMEVGKDTESFSGAVRNSLRHDPDIIVVGELRDLETIGAALTAAETGHLVLGTLHTVDATQTVDRMIDVFPYGQQPQIRHQIAQVLVGVFSQVLVPKTSGGRAPACEILIANSAVRNCIKEAKTQNLLSVIQVGLKEGMQTLNQALAALIVDNKVTKEEALKYSNDAESLNKIISSLTADGRKPDMSYITPGPEQKIRPRTAEPYKTFGK